MGFGEQRFSAGFYFIAVLVMSAGLTGCQKDFELVSDWVDYQSTEIPAASKQSRQGASVSDEVVNNVLRSSVTVQNFEFARFDDDTGSEGGVTDAHTSKMLRETIESVVANLPSSGKNVLASKINCDDVSKLSSCFAEKILSNLVGASTDKFAAQFAHYLPQIKDALPHMDSISEHILFQRIYQTFQRIATSIEGRGSESKSLGSGWFLLHEDELYVVTNNHVVERDFEALEKEKHPGRFKYSIVYLLPEKDEEGRYKKATTSATLVSRDPLFFDVALLKVDNQELKSKVALMPIGDDSAIRPGDTVVAVGSPHGLSATTTFGHVNYANRYIGGVYHHLIQHSALIHPGNSGGPLFNSKGEILGMNTYLLAGAYGCAVPISSFTKYLKSRLIEKRYDYFVAERGFIKVPEEGYDITLDLHLGRNRGKNYERVSGANMLMASETVPLDFTKDYTLSKNVPPGTTFSRYRVDGEEKTVDSATQVEFDVAFSKNGKLEVFVPQVDDINSGDWVSIPTRKFTRSDYRYTDSLINLSYATARGTKAQAVREKLLEGARDKTIKFFELDGSVDGKLYEYDFDGDGKKNLLYVSSRELLAFEKFNNLPISTIEEFRSILTEHMNRHAGASSIIPTVTFQFRNLNAPLPEYAKAILGEMFQNPSSGQKKDIFDQAVKNVNESVFVNVYKIYRENIKKILGMKPTEVNVEIREKVEFPQPEKNEARLLENIAGWGFGPAFVAINHALRGKDLDGTKKRALNVKTFWWMLFDSYPIIKKAKNCFSYSGTSGEVAGLGDFPDQYRFCTSGPAFSIAANGELKVNPEASIAVFRNSLNAQGTALSEAIREKYRLNEEKSFELYNLLTEIKASDFIESVKNYDLAKEDSLIFEGSRPFLRVKGKSTETEPVDPKGANALKAREPSFLPPPVIFANNSPLLNDYLFKSSLEKNGKPFLWINDLKTITSNDDSLSGYIFDLKTEDDGVYATESSFHLFNPPAKTKAAEKEVFSPEEWKEFKMQQRQAKEVNHFLDYSWNPDMRLATIEYNLPKIKKALASAMGIPIKENTSLVKVDRSRISIFYKKDRPANAINFYPVMNTMLSVKNYEMFGKRALESETGTIITGLVGGPIRLKKAEEKANAVSRWANRPMFRFSASVVENRPD